MLDGFGLLLVYVSGVLAISFVCSVLEAGLLSSRDSELAARANQGDKGAASLLELKLHRIDDAISAILTLNTIAHTVGATLAGAQAARVFGEVWVGVFTGVLTILVLVLTEIIPKTLGTVYASHLAGFVGRTTALLVKLLFPVIFVTRSLTRLLTRDEAPSVSRSEIAGLLALATRQGTVDADQNRLFNNVLRLEEIRVRDVMTPRVVMAMLPAAMTLDGFLSADDERTFSRIPVYDKNRDDVNAYIVQREVFNAFVSGTGRDTTLRELARPVWYLPAQVSIGSALRLFLERRNPMAIVVDEYGGVVGLVTLEDLIESVLGVEIVDETDRTVDMRAHAMQIRDERLRKLRENRLLVGHETESGS